jgi:hypothetical protein
MHPAMTTQVDIRSPSNNPDPAIAARIARFSFVLFVAGGVFGLLNMVWMPVPFGWGFEMVTLATNLAKHGTYANPFSVLDTGRTAAYTPLYPLYLSVLMRVFGNPDLAALAATIGNIVINAIIGASLPRVSWVFLRSVEPGVVAGIFWLLSVQLMPDWDASFTAAVLILFCVFSATTVDKPRYGLSAVLSGSMAGALFLLNPSSMIVFLLWLAYLLMFQKTPLKQTAIYVSIVLVLFATIAFAWGYRNQRQLGKFVVRTNLGMTLYASNNDCASPSLFEEENENCHEAYHPNTNLQEAQLLRSLGEVAYDRLRTADAKAWARNHPRRFLILTLGRFRDFWFPAAAGHPYKIAMIWLATLLSLPGLILMVRKRMEVSIFLLAVYLLFPVMYYVVVSDVRYRYPILWLTLLPAGFFIDALWKHAQSKWLSDQGRPA